MKLNKLRKVFIVMIAKTFNMVYALHNDKLVHISSVPGGLDCECICPACSGKLIAKKGLENVQMPYLFKKMLEKKYGKKYD